MNVPHPGPLQKQEQLSLHSGEAAGEGPGGGFLPGTVLLLRVQYSHLRHCAGLCGIWRVEDRTAE